MWTDGRYYLQARAEMDDNWLLMKDGMFSLFAVDSIRHWWREAGTKGGGACASGGTFQRAGRQKHLVCVRS